jgi:hypothetical protein
MQNIIVGKYKTSKDEVRKAKIILVVICEETS